MNIYRHLATATLCLEMGTIPEGFILIGGLSECVSNVVPSNYCRDQPGCYFLQETCHGKVFPDSRMQQ